MTPPDDNAFEMRKIRLDEDTAERLLRGKLAPEDAPPGYGHLASLIKAARSPASDAEMAGADRAGAAMSHALRVGSGISSPLNRRKSMLGKLLSAKVIAGVAAASLIGGTAAAAATGSLPSPAQSTVAGALSHIGISVPNPEVSSTGSAGTTSQSNSTQQASAGATKPTAQGRGPSISGPDRYGLCVAYSSSSNVSAGASSHKNQSVAFSNLAAAAKAADETIAKFCAGVTPPSSHSAASTKSQTPTTKYSGTSNPGTSHASSGSGSATTGSGASSSGSGYSGTSNPGITYSFGQNSAPIARP